MRIAPTAVLAVTVALATFPAQAHATGCTTVPAWPGPDAPRVALAAWMATGATAVGLPGELPVMGALVESGMTNATSGDADKVGYFGMRLGIWLGAYPGFPDNPQLQLRWFTDQALAAAPGRAARGIDNADPATWGEWVADVEAPAETMRFRYQLRLAEATGLIAAGCPSPGAPAATSTTTTAPRAPAADTTAPAVTATGSARQRLTTTGALRLRVRCGGEACLVRVRGRVAISDRRRALRMPEVDARLEAGRARTVAVAVGRAARAAVARAFVRHTSVRAILRIVATDAAGNATVRQRVIRIVDGKAFRGRA